MSKLIDPAYTNYVEQKRWSKVPLLASDGYYDEILAPLGLKYGDRILEIGFGEGTFLDWCSSNGIIAYGVEIIPELVEFATERGHTAKCEYLTENTFQDVRFNFVFAFDVFEHMSYDEIGSCFSVLDQYLDKEGKIVARFPNGASPFFGTIQFEDITHKSNLSFGAISQISRKAGFKLEGVLPDRPLGIGWRNRMRRRIAYLIRACIEIILGYAYFGRRCNFDQNLIVLIKRG